MSAPAIFLDRDGTLMENVGYCHRPEEVRVFPGVPEALERLREGGFRLVIVTNQSGIGRGYFSEADYHAVQAELLRQVGGVDAAYFCADAPDAATDRRKPGAGMLREAAAKHDLDLSRSYLIGDHASDIVCAKNAGLRGAALVLTGHGAEQALRCSPDFIAPSFARGRLDPVRRRARLSSQRFTPEGVADKLKPMNTIDTVLEADADGTLHVPLPARLQGAKVRIIAELEPVTDFSSEEPEARRNRVQAALKRLRERGTFRNVDAVAWQREIRADRPLPGREE